MLNKLKAFIAKNELINDGEKLLLAVSGGKDSVLMAHLFAQLNYDFSIAHCNFKLRAQDSYLDEQFVKELGQQLKVPVYSKTFDTESYAKENKLSIQMAARDLRYSWFRTLCLDEGYDKILTAHHQDDAIETLIIKKSRKASVGALQGIPVRNTNIIRPMLCFGVKDIQQYLTRNSINFREDKSNFSTYYQRNSIRYNLLSETDKRNQYLDEIKDNEVKYQSLLEKYETFRTRHCKVVDGGILLTFDYLLDQDEKQEILYEYLKYYGPFAWKDVFRLLNSEVGKQVSNADYRIVRERKGLFLSKSPSKALQSVLVKSGDSSIESPIKIAFSIHKAIDFKMVKNSRCAVLDYGKLHFPLLIRPWQIGDSFTPLGMKGKKKVSDFMIDEKFSTYQKENTLVICSLDTIVCIVGHRINDEFKLVPETEKVYLVEPLKIEHGK